MHFAKSLHPLRLTLAIGLLINCSFLAVYGQNLSPQVRQKTASEMDKALLDQLLLKWYPLAVDREKGGFYSSFTHDWKLGDNQDKMIVTQARHVWTNAKAAQRYPDIKHFRTSAAHGYAFLRDKMWDHQYGGFYTLVSRDGQPKNPNDRKTAYGNAFGIYGLAAYYLMSGDTAALNLGKKAFQWLDAHSHDPVKKGYFQHLERDGKPTVQARKLDMHDHASAELSYKDQNSSIHLLEAFTELYRAWPDSLLRERLSEMLSVIRDTIVTEQGALTLFLTPDWKPVSYRDSAEVVRKKHIHTDHVSFGHDVETAYLMQEAAHVLGLEHDERTAQIGKKMVDHSLRTGWDSKVGGFYDKGYYFKGSDTLTVIDDRKNWWAQAEGMNTLLIFTHQYPNDPMRYSDKFQTQWQYIQRYLIDPQYGGWYEWGIDKSPDSRKALKGHIWKAAYHDGRALMSCLHQLRPDTSPPSAPTDGKISRTKNGTTLQWTAARDNQRLLGYDIYQNGKRIGFTPLTHFVLPDTQLLQGAQFTIVAVDLQENKSKPAAVKL